MRAHFHFFNEVLLPFSMKAKELNCVLAVFAVEDFYILDLQRKYVTVVKELSGSLSYAQSMKHKQCLWPLFLWLPVITKIFPL